jgi:hypothetical protein
MATPSSTEPRRPERGDVIEFSFLWSHERDAGLLDSPKTRRCVIVAVLEGGARVIVAPITSQEPEHQNWIQLSGRAFGLTRKSWIITSELNVSIWPGPDLRPAAAPSGAWWRYGRLSDDKKRELADAIEALVKYRRARVVSRIEG